MIFSSPGISSGNCNCKLINYPAVKYWAINDNNMHIRNMSNDAVVSRRLSFKAHFHTQANNRALQTHLEGQNRFAFVHASECTWVYNTVIVLTIWKPQILEILKILKYD